MLLFAITVNIVKATANLEKFDTLFLWHDKVHCSFL